MTAFDPAVANIFSRYKSGELNKEEATQLLKPHFGPHEGPIISVLLKSLTRRNIVKLREI